MIIKGRCRGNGIQLAGYLLNTKDNDRADLLAINGSATPGNLRLSLLEMSLSSEITGRTNAGLYHAQLSPRIEEAADMTSKQKLRAVEILADKLGLQGQKWVLAEHEKDDRIHMHVVWERYNHDTGRMWDDRGNYAKHKEAARAMEMEFGWKLTYDKTNRLDNDIKGFIWEQWHKEEDPANFVQTMSKAGFEVTQGIDKRPFQIVDQHGTVFDLARQLDGIKQREVSEYLNSIRNTLRTTTEASKQYRNESHREQNELSLSDNFREMSDSQDLALLMLAAKRRQKGEQQKEERWSYSFKIKQPPSLPQKPAPLKIQSDKIDELSDSQEIALAMIKQFRQKAKDEAQKPANDNIIPPKRISPYSGREMTEEDYQKLIAHKQQQDKREQERERNRNKNRGYDIEY